MNENCSHIWTKFDDEFELFLKHSEQYQKIQTLINTSKGSNTGIHLLYEEAVQSHLNAKTSYIRLIAIYRELAIKWLEIAQQFY